MNKNSSFRKELKLYCIENRYHRPASMEDFGKAFSKYKLDNPRYRKHLEVLYRYYLDTFEKTKRLLDKIEDMVNYNPDDYLTKEQFAKVISKWRELQSIDKSNKELYSLDEVYRFYKDAFFRAPGMTIILKEPFIDPSISGFTSKAYGSIPNPPPFTNYFPLKSNIKKYSLHKVCPKGTYIIDFMFDKKMTYLVCINANTRYAMIKPTNKTDGYGRYLTVNTRSIKPFLDTLEQMRKEVENTNPMRYLTGDAEGAFNSRMAQHYYIEHNIEFHPIPRLRIQGTDKTQPLHSSLGIIDRFIRTIRDMLHTANYSMTPMAIEAMVKQYNSTFHNTLSKYLGFRVSPYDVQNDPDKEEYIAWRIMNDNLDIQYKDDFDLPVGTKIKVYNEKDVFGNRRRIARPGIIVGKQGVLFLIDSDLGREVVPRFKLESIY